MNKWITIPIIGVLAVGLGFSLVGCTQEEPPSLGATILEPLALEASESTVLEVLAKLEPSVVRINTYGYDWQRSGSGVIISNTGYVLTNYHVIASAYQAEIVLMSGEKYRATIAAHHGNGPLVLMKIISDRTDFPAAVLGSSADAIIGGEVIAIGYPILLEFQDELIFSRGRLAAVREWWHGDMWEIPSFTPLNPGGTGGPLINLKGEVIGTVTWGYIASSPAERSANIWVQLTQGLNFAIPIDVAKPFIQDTIE
jgi:S1-C subfamily serine protease